MIGREAGLHDQVAARGLGEDAIQTGRQTDRQPGKVNQLHQIAAPIAPQFIGGQLLGEGDRRGPGFKFGIEDSFASPARIATARMAKIISVGNWNGIS